MSLKITFIDTNTGKVIAEDELTDAEVKALDTELELANYKCPICGKVNTGIAGWICNAIKQKARQKIDEIVEKSGRGSKHTELSKKLQIIRELAEEGHELLKGAKQKQIELEERLKDGNNIPFYKE